MGVKLKAETGMTISNADLRAILTDYLGSASYGAFADLEVTAISQNSDSDFDLVLIPLPPAEPTPVDQS